MEISVALIKAGRLQYRYFNIAFFPSFSSYNYILTHLLKKKIPQKSFCLSISKLLFLALEDERN